MVLNILIYRMNFEVFVLVNHEINIGHWFINTYVFLENYR